MDIIKQSWIFFHLKLSNKIITIIIMIITAHSFSKIQKGQIFFTSTSQCNEQPWKPQFIQGKVGFAGVDIRFLILAQKHSLWVLVRTVSMRQSMFEENIKQILLNFNWKISFLRAIKASIVLHWYVILMFEIDASWLGPRYQSFKSWIHNIIKLWPMHFYIKYILS